MRIISLFVLASITLSACGSASPTMSIADIQATALAGAQTMVIQTQNAKPTPKPTRTKSPTNTPRPTATITNTPEPTQDLLFGLHSDGFYLVGVDIAPGVWRSTGTGDNCYWKVSTRNGGTVDNHFGLAGGTAYIPADAFQVEFNRCGAWEYLGPP